MLDMHLHVRRHRLIGEMFESAIVIYDAILEDLDERGALMLMRAGQNTRHMLLQGINSTGDEARPAPKCKAAGIQRRVHRTYRCRGRARAHLRCR